MTTGIGDDESAGEKVREGIRLGGVGKVEARDREGDRGVANGVGVVRVGRELFHGGEQGGVDRAL